MLFSAPEFFIFFVVYLALHFLLPLRQRLPFTILGSTLFYAYWNPLYLWVPYTLILISWCGAKWVTKDHHPNRKLRLFITIAALLIPLGFFKYTNFFYDLIMTGGRQTQKLIDFPLPIGISFISFTLLSYVIDLYRQKVPDEKNWEKFTASILFFPHLIAGPIVRPNQLIQQFTRWSKVRRNRFLVPLLIFSIGLFKKLFVADPLGQMVDTIYTNSSNHHSFEYLLAFYGFAAEIYCDFSGYTDMAIGLSAMLGIRLPINFNRPYLSESLIDFWQRWHITLSKWLRNYVYIPLGGNRHGQQIRNVMITMILGGLWHGASLTFVIWGTIHGVAIMVGHLALPSKWGLKLPKIVRIFLTFHCVALGWVFFRAPDFTSAIKILNGIFGNWTRTPNFSPLIFPIILLVFFFLTHGLDHHSRLRWVERHFPKPVVWGAILTLWILAISVSSGKSAQFIYFEF